MDIAIWEENLTLRFGHIDRSDRLTLGAVFDFFQEAAISHAECLGVGRDTMTRTGQVWVLSRISVLFDRRPKYGEALTIRTWPRGSEKLFAVRDYDVRDASNTPLIRGRSGWLVLDLEKRRPLRLQNIIGQLPRNEGLDALPGGGMGLAKRDDLVRAGERRAAYSDIDYNGHVNNVRYIQWIQDITDPGILEKADQLRLDINYLGEVRWGELTELLAAPIPAAADGGSVAFGMAGDVFALAYEGRRGDGQAVFRAELRTCSAG
jgi:acyl-ACP thioesterase